MGGVLFGLVLFSTSAAAAPGPAHSEISTKGYVGNEVCARCHAPINDSYSRTNMAHASGPVEENFIPADFTHPKSGVHYRIYREERRPRLAEF